MKWGCVPWGAFWWGRDPAIKLRAIALENHPPSLLVMWDVHPSIATTLGLVFHVYVNGVFYDTTRDTQIVVVRDETGRAYVEVFTGAEGFEAYDFTG